MRRTAGRESSKEEHGVVVLAEAHQEAAHERAVRQGERPERLGREGNRKIDSISR